MGAVNINHQRARLEEKIRKTLLKDGEAREDAFLIHPVVINEAILPTRPIKETFETISGIIDRWDPGVGFVADYRVGKTSAIEVIRRNLVVPYPGVPTFSFVAKNHDKNTENALYTDLLVDMHHSLAVSGTAVLKRQRFIRAMLEAAHASNSKRLIVFVDEAQNWAEPDLTRFRDIVNDLAREHVTLTTIMFGHSALMEVRSSLLLSKRTDVVGRFLLHIYEFRGISSLSDLHDLMMSFDDPEVSEFPAESGISYSEFFLPEAYKSGWRLAGEAECCWSSFKNKTESDDVQVGMQWISSAIRDFLFYQKRIDCPGLVGTMSDWARSVNASGFDDTLNIY